MLHEAFEGTSSVLSRHPSVKGNDDLLVADYKEGGCSPFSGGHLRLVISETRNSPCLPQKGYNRPHWESNCRIGKPNLD